MVESYDDTPSAEDAAFAGRIAAHLRAPESAHPSFEKRLMDKVRFEGASLYPRPSSASLNWWRKEWVIRLSPRVGIAIAAGISAIIALSAVAVGSRIAARSQPSAIAQVGPVGPARDTVQLVRFVFVDSGAASVALVGDFNEWTRGATELKPSGAPGVWSVSVALTRVATNTLSSSTARAGSPTPWPSRAPTTSAPELGDPRPGQRAARNLARPKQMSPRNISLLFLETPTTSLPQNLARSVCSAPGLRADSSCAAS